MQNKISRPIRKATVSTPTNVIGLSRANTNIVGTPKLAGHHLTSRNITNVQHGITKGINISYKFKINNSLKLL